MSESASAEREYEAYLAEGRFMIQRARHSGGYVFYPRIAEPGTGDDLEWVEPSGLGTVYAVTAIHPRPPKEAYNVVIVELDEGPRLMSRVERMPVDEVAIGLRVMARVSEGDGGPLVVFDPVEA